MSPTHEPPMAYALSVTIMTKGGQPRTAIIEKESGTQYITCRKVRTEDIRSPDDEEVVVGHRVTVMPHGEFNPLFFVSVWTTEVRTKEVG